MQEPLFWAFHTGKTSLIRRYVDGIFDKHYCATLGGMYHESVFRVDKHGTVYQLFLFICFYIEYLQHSFIHIEHKFKIYLFCYSNSGFCIENCAMGWWA